MRSIKSKATILIMSIFISLSQIGCGKENIEKTIAIFTRSVKVAREVTTEQYEYKYITAEQYKARLELFKKVYITTDVLGDKIAEFGEINSTNKLQALALVRDVNASVIALLNSGNLGVKNEATRAKFNTALLSASATLSSIEIAIAASRKPIPTSGIKIEAAPVTNE
jgi:hypothetical protein